MVQHNAKRKASTVTLPVLAELQHQEAMFVFFFFFIFKSEDLRNTDCSLLTSSITTLLQKRQDTGKTESSLF